MVSTWYLERLQVHHHLPGFQDFYIAMVVQQGAELVFELRQMVDTGMHGVCKRCIPIECLLQGQPLGTAEGIAVIVMRLAQTCLG